MGKWARVVSEAIMEDGTASDTTLAIILMIIGAYDGNRICNHPLVLRAYAYTFGTFLPFVLLSSFLRLLPFHPDLLLPRLFHPAVKPDNVAPWQD